MADNATEKHISKAKLSQLMKTDDLTKKAAEDKRNEFKKAFNTAVENNNLNSWAYKQAKALMKMDEAKASRSIRALLLYVDHLGLDNQLDLEDAIQNQDAAEIEPAWVKLDDGAWHQGELVELHPDNSATIKLPDGATGHFPEGDFTLDDPIKADTLTDVMDGGSPVLAKFRDAIASTTSAVDIDRGLGRFLQDHPHHAAEAQAIANDRMLQLGLKSTGDDDGWGDGAGDIRPSHMRPENQEHPKEAGRKAVH